MCVRTNSAQNRQRYKDQILVRIVDQINFKCSFVRVRRRTSQHSCRCAITQGELQRIVQYIDAACHHPVSDRADTTVSDFGLAERLRESPLAGYGRPCKEVNNNTAQSSRVKAFFLSLSLFTAVSSAVLACGAGVV